MRRTIKTLLLAAAALGVFGGTGMGLFSKLILFSPVEGTVTVNGEPAAGAEIIQAANWNKTGETLQQKTTTDSAGRYSLAAIQQSAGLSRLSASQEIIKQSITISYKGKTYEGWRFMKNDYELNSENKGKPLRLTCDLATKADYVDYYYGVCRLS